MKNIFHLKQTLALVLLLVVFSLPLSIQAQNWDQIIKAVASDRATEDSFGYSVAISGDYAIVGAAWEDHNPVGGGLTLITVGAAYIFKRTGTTWAQETKIVASDGASFDQFGWSVSISGDYAIVGALSEDHDAAGGAMQSSAGSAYIFKRMGTTWVQEIKIVASDRAELDMFGHSVALSGDYAIVGAHWEDEDATGSETLSNAGAAYIFKRTGSTWAQEAKITASDRDTNDSFGWSVAISGDYAIVGATNEDEVAAGGATLTDAGSAYIFKRTKTTWEQEIKIVASDRGASDWFGITVAISGDYAIVGASHEDEDATGNGTLSNAGSAYIFKRTETIWAQEAKIVASDRTAGDRFGGSVAISGDYAIMGANYKNVAATGGTMQFGAGSAYIFKRSGTNWAQEAKIVASDRAMNDFFGLSVAISGDHVIVGAGEEDEDAAGGATLMGAGSVYFYQRSVATSVEDLSISAKTSVFPNPSNGMFTISGLKNYEGEQFMLLNSKGESVSVTVQNNGQLDLSAYPSGMYYLRVTSTGDVIKLVKE